MISNLKMAAPKLSKGDTNDTWQEKVA